MRGHGVGQRRDLTQAHVLLVRLFDEAADDRLRTEQFSETRDIVGEQRPAQLRLESARGESPFQLRSRGVAQAGVASELLQEIDGVLHFSISPWNVGTVS